ncbi:MAG: hypothetical protein KAW17_04895 [Candidatus Eisenbacteria sp.]|nr:hypothetical protein [Candidatus Eisenbacteria bacterium]
MEEDLDNLLARRVVRWGLSVPAVFLLEICKPLAFVGSQMFLFWGPVAHLLVDPERYDRFVERMASRENWEKLIQRIEEMERKQD